MGGEKNHQRKDEIWIRAVQKQTKTLQDRITWDFQIIHNFWSAKKGGEMSSWKENFPAAKVFNMWTSKWTSSDESMWFHGHRLHRWSRC